MSRNKVVVQHLTQEPSNDYLPKIGGSKPPQSASRKLDAIRNDTEKRVSSQMDVYDSDKMRPSLKNLMQEPNENASLEKKPITTPQAKFRTRNNSLPVT